MFRFGEEFRPCLLQKFVYGYQQTKDEFSFQSSLNHKLFDLIVKHSKGRPSLVFVSTRKATVQAAEAVAERYRKMQEEVRPDQLPWPRPAVSSSLLSGGSGGFADPSLDRLASLGISFHHAGLSFEDRREVERRFLAEEIRVLCSTSTLATGVNLPAYCVVIRGTKQYAGNQWAELSDLDVIQMMGRAGRPQFDREGVAVIMCDQRQRQRYEELVSGGRDIESTLSGGLLEHINAEIGLCSIRDVYEVERWLRSTFYAVRLRRKAASANEVDALISRLSADAVRSLGENRLVQRYGPDSAKVEATEAGAIMSRYYLSYGTMLRLLKVEAKPSLARILETLAQADEFGDLRIRQGEKPFLQSLRTLSEIRFPPRGVGGIADKVSILIQATLAGINIQSHLQGAAAGSFNPFGDIGAIFRHAPRICKAMLDLSLDRSDGAMAKVTFELLRSLSGKAWDGSPAVLRQLEGIGEKSIKALAAGGLATLAEVADAAPHEIELLLNRNPPFGSKVVRSARSLPRFELTVAERGSSSATGGKGRRKRGSDSGDPEDTVEVAIEVTVALRDYGDVTKKSRASGLPLYVCVLSLSSDMDLYNFSRLPISKLSEPKSFSVSCPLSRRGQKVVVLAGCDEVAGSLVRAELRPSVPNAAFPTPVPASFDALQDWENEHLLEGLDAEADFFNVDDLDDDGDNNRPLAKAAGRRPPEDTEPPVRLDNGNYRCRHTCKGRCRHLCCREGMPKPPKRLSSAKAAQATVISRRRQSSTPPPSGSRREPRQRRAPVQTENEAEKNLLEKIERLNRRGQGQQRSDGGDGGASKRRRLPTAQFSSDEVADIGGALDASSEEDLPLFLGAFARRQPATADKHAKSTRTSDAAATAAASPPDIQTPRPLLLLSSSSPLVAPAQVSGPATEPELLDLDDVLPASSIASPVQLPRDAAGTGEPKQASGRAISPERDPSHRQNGIGRSDLVAPPPAMQGPQPLPSRRATAPMPRTFLRRIGPPPWSLQPGPEAPGLARDASPSNRTEHGRDSRESEGARAAAFAIAKAALSSHTTPPSEASSGAGDAPGGTPILRRVRDNGDDGDDGNDEDDGWRAWIKGM
ncbi:ATP-dependent DNA helicase MER3 [Thecaphora frezii]